MTDPVTKFIRARGMREATEEERVMCCCPWEALCVLHPEMYLMQRAGHQLREMRIAAGMSQIALATALGTTQTSISATECGRFNLGLRRLTTVAHQLHGTVRLDIMPQITLDNNSPSTQAS